jgi:hypothetical protein
MKNKNMGPLEQNMIARNKDSVKEQIKSKCGTKLIEYEEQKYRDLETKHDSKR